MTTGGSGPAYSVVYTDASGNPVTSPVAAGEYNVRVTITDPNDSGSATGQLRISPAPLSVSGITASGKVYDGTTTADVDASGASLSGVLPCDDVALDGSAATGSFDTKDIGTGKTVTITGPTLTGADAGDYVIAPGTTSANVTPATLTVTGITAADKVFDGTTAATIVTIGAVLVGVIGGDDVTLDVTNAVGTFDTPDVGTDRTVFITGLALTGADAGDYTLVDPTTTASITSS